MKCRYVGGDIKKYLDECFIRYNGVPYYASVDGLNVHLIDLETRQATAVVRGDDPLLDISSIPLGYVNIGRDYCLHIKRYPYRKWKQGVCMANIQVSIIGRTADAGRITKDHLICQEFKNSILGNFPNWTTAFRMLSTKERCSVALSNSVGVKRNDHTLEFLVDEQVIGYIDLREKNFSVVNTKKSEFSWVYNLEISKIPGLEVA
jgi:hypothetical protein